MTEDLTPLEKVIAERSVCIVLVRGRDESDDAIWAYVAVKVANLQAFMQAQAQGNFDPEQYGMIVEAGYGDMPPAGVTRRMESDYGFNHQKMLDLTQNSSS